MAKYYIVPAEIFESNFPDDLSLMVNNNDVAVIESELEVDKIAEIVNPGQKTE